jgi:hypothetical protein
MSRYRASKTHRSSLLCGEQSQELKSQTMFHKMEHSHIMVYPLDNFYTKMFLYDDLNRREGPLHGLQVRLIEWPLISYCRGQGYAKSKACSHEPLVRKVRKNASSIGSSHLTHVSKLSDYFITRWTFWKQQTELRWKCSGTEFGWVGHFASNCVM